MYFWPIFYILSKIKNSYNTKRELAKMFRLFAKQDEQALDLRSRLSQTTWINPNINMNATFKKALIFSLLTLNKIGKASANALGHDGFERISGMDSNSSSGIDSYYFKRSQCLDYEDYLIYTDGPSMNQGSNTAYDNLHFRLNTLLKEICTYSEASNRCYDAVIGDEKIYGEGTFAGYRCKISYLNDGMIDNCVDEVARQTCGDRHFGTDEDYFIVATMVTAGLCMMALAFYAYRRWQARQQPHQRQELNDAHLEDGVIWYEDDSEENHASQWDELRNKLDALIENGNPEAVTLLDDFNAVEASFKDSITLSMMTHPVTLPCRHNFDQSQINEWRVQQIASNHEAGCPCCREPYEVNDLNVNEVMKAAIDFKIRYFTREIDRISQGLVANAPLRTSSRLSRNSLYSSRFISLESSMALSARDEDREGNSKKVIKQMRSSI